MQAIIEHAKKHGKRGDIKDYEYYKGKILENISKGYEQAIRELAQVLGI